MDGKVLLLSDDASDEFGSGSLLDVGLVKLKHSSVKSHDSTCFKADVQCLVEWKPIRTLSSVKKSSFIETERPKRHTISFTTRKPSMAKMG